MSIGSHRIPVLNSGAMTTAVPPNIPNRAAWAPTTPTTGGSGSMPMVTRPGIPVQPPGLFMMTSSISQRGIASIPCGGGTTTSLEMRRTRLMSCISGSMIPHRNPVGTGMAMAHMLNTPTPTRYWAMSGGSPQRPVSSSGAKTTAAMAAWAQTTPTTGGCGSMKMVTRPGIPV